MPLQKIRFQTNITVEAALKFTEGILCDRQFGGAQNVFTTADDRVFFVAEKAAQKIHGLRLHPREVFEITKTEVIVAMAARESTGRSEGERVWKN